jgi:DNA-binding MarR family transcriptional regulator
MDQRPQLERSVLHLLHRASQCASDIFSSETTALTPRQYAVLATVEQNEGASQTMLVRRSGIDRSTLSEMMRRMMDRGLLVRERNREDARAYTVRLTEEGRRLLRQAEPIARHVDQMLLDAMPPERREEFLQRLSSVIEVCEKHNPMLRQSA